MEFSIEHRIIFYLQWINIIKTLLMFYDAKKLGYAESKLLI